MAPLRLRHLGLLRHERPDRPGPGWVHRGRRYLHGLRRRPRSVPVHGVRRDGERLPGLHEAQRHERKPGKPRAPVRRRGDRGCEPGAVSPDERRRFRLERISGSGWNSDRVPRPKRGPSPSGERFLQPHVLARAHPHRDRGRVDVGVARQRDAHRGAIPERVLHGSANRRGIRGKLDDGRGSGRDESTRDDGRGRDADGKPVIDRGPVVECVAPRRGLAG